MEDNSYAPPKMRAKNLVGFVCVVLGAFGAYVLFGMVTTSLVVHRSGAVAVEGNSVWVFLAIAAAGTYGILAAAGAVLWRLLDSNVPLKWCLALGLLFASAYTALSATYAPDGSPWPIRQVIFLIVASVIGGYVMKRKTANL
jgi:uncharacterized membrane protein YfcA